VAALLAEAAIQGFLLGLSTGLFCLATCAPALVPFIMAEERGPLHSAIALGELALGRLLAYLSFGLAVGYAGVKLNGPWLDEAIGIAMISLSTVMLLFVASRKMPHPGLCILRDKYFRFPALFGFLTGINVCPPFLLAISSAAAMGSLWGSVLLFGGFFLGTTIYLVLLIPLGFLGAYEPVRITGLITIVLSSIYFLGLGITYLI
jgi:hypothetical protein